MLLTAVEGEEEGRHPLPFFWDAIATLKRGTLIPRIPIRTSIDCAFNVLYIWLEVIFKIAANGNDGCTKYTINFIKAIFFCKRVPIGGRFALSF